MKSLTIITIAIVICLTGCASTYKEPLSGPILTIKNPHEYDFKIWIDGYKTEKLKARKTCQIRIEPTEHIINTKNKRILPLICFWHFTTRSKDWAIDASPGEDISLIIDHYRKRSHWFLIL
jgi:hypothetical protein